MNNPGVLIFAFALFEEDYRRRFMRLERRNLRDRHNPFEIPDAEFINTFRLNKPLAQEVIDTLIIYAERGQRRTRIPFHLRALVTFNFYAGGSYQRRTAGHNLTCMGQSMVSRSIYEVSTLITTYMMPNKIKFPTTNETRNSTKEGFYQKWEIRGVIGAIDGTHIEIVAPPETDVDYPPFVYNNRKGRHSINFMLICDSDNMILAVDARYPGSTHDAAVWQMSDIKHHLQNNYNNGDRSSHLIGDSGYGLEPWLFTPVTNCGPNTPEQRYNVAHKRARNVIERTNGILKSRFRCLSRHRVLHYHPATSAYIIYARCVLHNMMREARLIDDEDEIENDVDPENDEELPQNNLLLARQIRAEHIQQNYA